MNVLLAIVLIRMLLQPLPTGEVANPSADFPERDFPLSGSLRRQLSPRRAFELVHLMAVSIFSLPLEGKGDRESGG